MDDKDSFQDGSDENDVPPVPSNELRGKVKEDGTFKTDGNPFHIGSDDESDLSAGNNTDDEADRTFSYDGSREEEYDGSDIDEEKLG